MLLSIFFVVKITPFKIIYIIHDSIMHFHFVFIYYIIHNKSVRSKQASLNQLIFSLLNLKVGSLKFTQTTKKLF